MDSAVVEIETKAYGKINVSGRQGLFFPAGLYGLSDFHDFYLIDGEDGAFSWLQAKDTPDIAFPLIDPFLFVKDYNPQILASSLEPVDLHAVGDVLQSSETLCLVIVTIPQEKPNEMTVNLLGPLIINVEKRVGIQVVAQNTQYQTRHYLLEELREYRGEG